MPRSPRIVFEHGNKLVFRKAKKKTAISTCHLQNAYPRATSRPRSCKPSSHAGVFSALDDAAGRVVLPFDGERPEASQDVVEFLGDDFHLPPHDQVFVHGRPFHAVVGAEVVAVRLLVGGHGRLVPAEQVFEFVAVGVAVGAVRQNDDAVAIQAKQPVKGVDRCLAIAERRVRLFDLLDPRVLP